MPGERLDQRVFTVVLPVLEAGECVHPDEVAVARQHFGDLDDMLRPCRPLPSGFKPDPPHAVARLQDDRRGAQLGGADLERGARGRCPMLPDAPMPIARRSISSNTSLWKSWKEGHNDQQRQCTQ